MTFDEPGQLEGPPGVAIGKCLDGWLLQELLGLGGMGAVYRATHVDSGVIAALKVVRSPAGSSVEIVKRFRREVQALARLEHPAIVRIVQESLAHSPPYFCMEFLPGGSLSALVRQRREKAQPGQPILDPEWLAKLSQELAEGLTVVHAGNILHRDIKPLNILFTATGQAKLSDFGLAKLQDATAMTAPNQVMGSVQYMAPEALRAKGFTERSDLYQLGATLFDAATGQPPYTVEQLIGVSYNLPLPPPADLASLAPALTQCLPWFEPMLRRLLADSPDARFSSAAELATHIAAQRRQGAGPRPVSSGTGHAASRQARPGPGGRAAGDDPAKRRATTTWIDSASPGPLHGRRRLFALAGAALLLWGVCLAGFALQRNSRNASSRAPASQPAAAARPLAPANTSAEPLFLPPSVTVGATSAHLWFDRPPPRGSRLELREVGSSSGRTRELTGSVDDLMFEGLVPDTEYHGVLLVGRGEKPFAFRTLKKALLPGSALLCREQDEATELRLEAAGDQVVALWKRSKRRVLATRLETARSADGGLTWTPPEVLASSTGTLHSPALTVGVTDAVAAWREGEPNTLGGQLCVRHWSRESGRWGPILKAPCRFNHEGLGFLRRAEGIDLFAVADISGDAYKRVLAAATLALDRPAPPRFEPVLALQTKTGGSIRVALGYDTVALAVDDRRDNLTWDISLTSASLGERLAWRPTRPLAAPDDDAGKFDLAALGDDFVVVYEAGGQLFTRLISGRGRELSAKQRLPSNDLIQTMGTLTSGEGCVYLAHLVSDPINLLSGAIRLYRSTDGLRWERLPGLSVRNNILLRLRLAVSGRRLLALTAGDVDRVALSPLPLPDGP